MSGESELEKRVRLAQQYGEEWAKLHEAWLQLDEAKKNFLSALMNDLEKGSTEKIPESKLERLARGSAEYQKYIERMCIARGQELRAKVKYESARSWFEAGRSLESTERAKMKMF
jgi:hypothetical protein